MFEFANTFSQADRFRIALAVDTKNGVSVGKRSAVKNFEMIQPSYACGWICVSCVMGVIEGISVLPL